MDLNRIVPALSAAAALAAAAAAAPVPATAAPADVTGVRPGGHRRRSHPGVQMYTAGAQCTANFVSPTAPARRLRRLRRALRRAR